MGDGILLSVDTQLDLGGRRFAYRASVESYRVLLTGPSGSGKTTLLRVIAGLEPRAQGHVVVLGMVWENTDTDGDLRWPVRSRRVGWVPQRSLLFPHLSVKENLEFGEKRRNNFDEVVESLQLAHVLEACARDLSAADRQLVALGRAILGSPLVLLLDEPVSAMGSEAKNRALGFVTEYCEHAGIFCVLATRGDDELAAFFETSLPIHEICSVTPIGSDS